MKAIVVFDVDDSTDFDGAKIEYAIVDKNGNRIPVEDVNGLKVVPRKLTYLSCYFQPEIHRCKTKTDAFIEGFNTVVKYLEKRCNYDN